MLSLDQFASELFQEVLVKCTTSPTPQPMQEEAFTESVLERLTEHNEVNDWNLCYYEARNQGQRPAAKINAWSLSADGATLDLFTTLYHGEGKVVAVTRAEAEQQFKLARGFLRRALGKIYEELDESHDAFQVARSIYEATESLTTVRLFVLTDGVVKSFEIDEEQLPGIELRYVLWDLEKLSRLQVGTREIISLDFMKDYGGAVPCIATADATGEYRTFLAFLAAPTLAKIYGEHGQRLLERNVRAFLQAKGKVNKGLQETLREQPHRFLAYNNGLCCTAAEVDVDTDKSGHARLLRVRDFQIVNGGQTTASIYHALKKEKTDVSKVVVQVKLTVLTDPAKVVEIVPLISKFANSQNKVNTADFSANDAFHQNLEKLSRTVWAPATGGLAMGTRWYYERARGSYMDDKSRAGTPAQRRKWEDQHPPSQKFTKTDVAKFENSWDQLPHNVSLGAEKNFTEWTLRRQNEGVEASQEYFERLVAKAILFRTTEKIVSAQNFGGYRANIVTYTLAWLSLDKGQWIDLKKIWQRQAIGEPLAKAIEVICHKAHEAIESPERTKQNVTEWCKQEECWLRFRDVKISLPEISSELVAAGSTAASNGSSPVKANGSGDSNGKATAGEMLARVERLRLDVWPALASWGQKTGALKPWQITFAGNIGKKLARGKKPPHLECKEALALLDDAQAKGFMP